MVEINKGILTKRIEWVDICKGLGICLVIIGHTSIANISPILYDWIYSFHMPLFYMLSGLMFNPDKYDTLVKYLNRRVRSLIIPFLLLNTILFILVRWTNLLYIQLQWTELLTGVLAMYFIRVLFITELWYYLIDRCSSSVWFKLLVIIFSILVCDYLRHVDPICWGSTRNEDMGVFLPSIALFYYALGQTLRKYTLLGQFINSFHCYFISCYSYM